MKGSCRNDTVRHIRNNIAGNVLQRVCYVRIHSGDEHSRTWIGQGRAKPLQSVKWKRSSFDQIDRFNEGYRRDADVTRVADSIFNRSTCKR